jgi:hypothetical protein
MNKIKSLGIVIPIYCNEYSIQILIKKLESLNSTLKEQGIDCIIAFVDDGSTDKSWSTLINAKIDVKSFYIKHTKNYGTVRAIKSGLNFLDCDVYTSIAADLQDPPELIIEMIKYWITGDNKIILCRRRNKKDSFLTDLFSKFYCYIMNKLQNNYPNGGFDIALIDKQYINYFKSIPNYMYFQPLLIGLGAQFKTLEYDRPLRVHGRSMNNIKKKIRDFSDSILSISNLPLRFVTFLAVSISTLSLLYSVIVILNNLFVGNAVPGYTTIIALLSFLCGSIIFMLGIIGEYVWRIYDSKYGIPKPVIEINFKNF